MRFQIDSGFFFARTTRRLPVTLLQWAMVENILVNERFGNTVISSVFDREQQLNASQIGQLKYENLQFAFKSLRQKCTAILVFLT